MLVASLREAPPTNFIFSLAIHRVDPDFKQGPRTGASRSQLFLPQRIAIGVVILHITFIASIRELATPQGPTHNTICESHPAVFHLSHDDSFAIDWSIFPSCETPPNCNDPIVSPDVLTRPVVHVGLIPIYSAR